MPPVLRYLRAGALTRDMQEIFGGHGLLASVWKPKSMLDKNIKLKVRVASSGDVVGVPAS